MGTLLKTLVILILAITAALAFSFTPATLEPDQAPSIEGVERPNAKGVRLAAIVSGSIESLAALAYRGGSFHEQREFVVGAILVTHPQGNLLFDTGFGADVDQHIRTTPWLMQQTSTYTKGVPVAEQLAAAGFDLARIANIVLTHAHWDHISGLPDLVGPTIMMSSAEAAFARSGHPSMKLMETFGRMPITPINYRGGAYLGFESSLDLYSDGTIVIVPAAGHTPGGIIAFINTEDGKRYALIGDLVWQREGIDLPAERPLLSRMLVDMDAAAVRAGIVHLHQLKQGMPELIIVPAHDARVWRELPQFPLPSTSTGTGARAIGSAR